MEKTFILSDEEHDLLLSLVTLEIAEINDYLNSDYAGPNVKRVWSEKRDKLKVILKKIYKEVTIS